ncbi:MAG: homoserine kinase [Candidatus Omnitrophica bacterium]|nr:homoserine kinase [Candidatus Omnitrophota bacterium]
MATYIISVPASIGNLGSGFDCAGVSLRLMSTYTVRISKHLRIESDDPRIPINRTNLVWRAYQKTMRSFFKPVVPLHLVIQNRIPPGAGLGGSGAAVIAGVICAFLVNGQPLVPKQILTSCLQIEQHPDNVAASLIGGFVVTTSTRQPEYCHLPVPKGWKAVVFIPSKGYDTKEARRILPLKVSRQDAVFNLSRCCFLTLAFKEKKEYYLKVGMEDALHQPHRARIYPHLAPLYQLAMENGAAGCCLSGAGPAVAAISSHRWEGIVDAWKDFTRRKRWSGEVIVVSLGGKTSWKKIRDSEAPRANGE